MTQDVSPLILTLAFDQATFALLNGLRARHFPPERNVIPAHLTLFHALPGAHEVQIHAHLAAQAALTPALPLTMPSVRFLGRGVALDVVSQELVALRQQLARHWLVWLTPQDQQRYRPHVTIQNKVSPDVARRLYAELRVAWLGHTGRGEALLLWHYLGGPWELRARVPFAAGTTPTDHPADAG